MKPILIVEDEVIMRESLRDWLSDNGYRVETASEGEEALQAIAEQDFGVAILDLRLPGKDGIEVLRQARATRPQLKGIIITAYPSIESGLAAIKAGAIDYLPKPFDLNNLELIIRETLGPVQVAFTPKPPAAVPEDIEVQLEQGKAAFDTGHYQQAIKEFESVMDIAPGNIKGRVLLKNAKRALLAVEVKAVDEAITPATLTGKLKECLWMKMGIVGYRLCTKNYHCVTCEFDQIMQERMAVGDAPEVDAALKQQRSLPGSQRLCRYALKEDISYRVCTSLFQCACCEFGQIMDNAVQQKLAKLAFRRRALHHREQRAG